MQVATLTPGGGGKDAQIPIMAQSQKSRKYKLPPKPFHDLTTESNVHKSKTRQHYHPVQQSHSGVFT